MPKYNPRELRALAEELYAAFAATPQLDLSQADFVNTLVRQWMTYDGRAILILSMQPTNFDLSTSPLGRLQVVPEIGVPGWLQQVFCDWEIDPDYLPTVIAQLNRGQSAEVTNQAGNPLRLWQNPRARSYGVEELTPQPLPPLHERPPRDERRIAGVELFRHLQVDDDELIILTETVVQQWQRFAGHACVFLGLQEQLLLKLTEQEHGGCLVETQRRRVNLGPVFADLGFAPDDWAAGLARLNRGQPLNVSTDQYLGPVWYDPQARCFRTQVSAALPTAPVWCPRCQATLAVWGATQLLQTCTHCQRVVQR
jgi:hypothetical protein